MRCTLPLLAVSVLVFSLGCSKKESSDAGGPSAKEVRINEAALAGFSPLPNEIVLANVETTPAKVELGRMLYYEPRLSKSQKISCNSCHDLNAFGVDNESVSEGHMNQTGDRNSPTVYNAAGHIAQFWDGRATDVIEQAKGPILNPVEMAMPDEATVVKTLKSIPGYVALFEKAFPDQEDPVTYDNMAEAIGVFETKLITRSRWDRFLEGDGGALTDEEKIGFNKFVESGCNSCHSGPYLGGHLYNKIGLVKPWPNVDDLGRYEVTKRDSDKFFFKVPSLRNVVNTGPYLHDGNISSLDTLIVMMAEHQMGKELADDDTESIKTFLAALVGEIPWDQIKKPELPASGPNTPKPVLE